MPELRTRTARTGVAIATVALLAPIALSAPTWSARAAGPAADRGVGRTPTEFALRGSGFATDVKGGRLPAAAGATALAVIGCTTKTGIDRGNDLASVRIPGLGTVAGSRTRTWTSRSGDEVAITTRHRVGEVVLSDSPLGTLSLSAITTIARAAHDGTGFHADTSTDVGGLTFTPPGGAPQELELPLPGRPVTIPDVATISLASTWTRERSDRARAFANGLLVHLLRTDTRVRVAHAGAEIFSGARHGVFAGSAYGVSGSIGGELVGLGRNPMQRVPCQGTGGTVRRSSLAGLDLAGQIKVGAMTSEGLGAQTGAEAWGFSRATVAEVDLAGALRIEGVVAQATVERRGRKVSRSSDGSSLGAVTVDGERRYFPDTGPLEIPGVARLEPLIVQRLATGLKVTGLRVTLLDGTGAVLDLATARLRIGRGGNPT